MNKHPIGLGDQDGGPLPYQYASRHTPFRDLVPLRLRHGPPLCGVPHLELHRSDFGQLFHHSRHERIALVHQAVRETDELAGVLRNAPEGGPVERAGSQRTSSIKHDSPLNQTDTTHARVGGAPAALLSTVYCTTICCTPVYTYYYCASVYCLLYYWMLYYCLRFYCRIFSGSSHKELHSRQTLRQQDGKRLELQTEEMRLQYLVF